MSNEKSRQFAVRRELPAFYIAWRSPSQFLSLEDPRLIAV